MDASIVAAGLSAASALVVAAITYSLTKRREREAEWRRFKLDHYREYVVALSGVTKASETEQNQRRYADAVNSLSLVAPPAVLHALYAFQDEVRFNNPSRTPEGHDAKLSALFRAIRRDVQPSAPDDADLAFRLFDAPPPSSARP